MGLISIIFIKRWDLFCCINDREEKGWVWCFIIMIGGFGILN